MTASSRDKHTETQAPNSPGPILKQGYAAHSLWSDWLLGFPGSSHVELVSDSHLLWVLLTDSHFFSELIIDFAPQIILLPMDIHRLLLGQFNILDVSV